MTERVTDALKVHEQYVADLMAAYEVRNRERQRRNIRTISFIGHSRCGKDEAGVMLAKVSDFVYGGSLSQTMLPLVAYSLKQTTNVAWDTRHANKAYWFHFLNEVRKTDAVILCKMLLGRADITTGTRAKPELLTSFEQGVAQHLVWINRLASERDPTMEYDAKDVISLLRKYPSRVHWIDNNGTLEDLQLAVKEVYTKEIYA